MTMWVIYEKKKILAEGGFEPQISGRECKMQPLSYGELLQWMFKKSLHINAPLIQFFPFLVNLRHFTVLRFGLISSGTAHPRRKSYEYKNSNVAGIRTRSLALKAGVLSIRPTVFSYMRSFSL